MAKIMLGSLAGAISGALGNDVFSHNRHGYYVRRRVIPTKVTSDYTTVVRNNLAACSRAWGALSEESQQAWNTWAQSHPITDRLGQKQVLFGAGAYTMLNARIMFAGDTPIDLPPAAVAPAPLTSFSCAPEEATQTCIMTFLPATVAATERLWVQAALVVNPGQNYFKNLLKSVYIGALETPSLEDLGPDVVARFGSMQETQRLICLASVYESTSGLLSGPTLYTATVAAS
jgi:hypothetical protein